MIQWLKISNTDKYVTEEKKLLIEYNNKLFYTSKDLALSVIGGRWKIPIIYHLLQSEVLRLSELEKKFQIYQLKVIQSCNVMKNQFITANPYIPNICQRVEKF